MKRTLQIKLRSDLCAGVGKHFASIIDLDTALDEYGFPYIPSRRLKGCMREVAEYLCDADQLDSLFGKRGDEKSGSLSIQNAIAFPTYEAYYDSVRAVKKGNISHVEITDLYCSVREQTSIDEATGSAKDQSLRYTRVVNRYTPDSDPPMCFYAPIEFDDSSEKTVSQIVAVLRNIGYHRNRGLGAVECCLVDSDMTGFVFDEVTFEEDKEYELSYLVRLDSDLMMPDSDSSHTMDYIPGTMVLGALASAYRGESFNKVFLSGDAKFGNLYISDPHGNRYIPSPRFLAKIKAAGSEEEKGIKNTIGIDVTKAQYKPLKHGYINTKYGYVEPETKIVYHNSINTEDGGLYMQYCLCSNQYYAGSICAKGSALGELYPLFRNGALKFGRSKTAQYSNCSILHMKVKEREKRTSRVQQGSIIAFVLQSDTIITDSYGNYTVDKGSLLQTIADAAGIETNALSAFAPDDLYLDKTTLCTKIISGYNAKWNLKKPQIKAIGAGSAVIVRANRNLILPSAFTIGDKQNEGFGEICTLIDAEHYIIEDNKDKEAVSDLEENKTVALVKQKRAKDALLLLAIERAVVINRIGLKALNKSQLGRLTLMCKESDDIKVFEERIGSIKTSSIREEAERFFSEKEILSEVKTDEWESISYYIIKVLTVLKYLTRKENQ